MTLCELCRKEVKNTKKIQEHDRCEYCHKKMSTVYRLNTHRSSCGMRNDIVRVLEMRLSRTVALDPTSTRCRFCDRQFSRVDNLHRHDAACKEKEEYKMELLREIHGERYVPKRSANVVFDDAMDWNDTRAIRRLLAHLIPLSDIKKYTKTGDVSVSMGDIARMYYTHNDSVDFANTRVKDVRCRENGAFVTRDSDYVIRHVIEPMIHRVQDACDVGIEIPNIDEYGRLDRLLRLDAGHMSREDREFVRKVLEEQRRATRDSANNRII